MTSKIRIRIGDVEVEYEGSEDFLKNELQELLSGVLELHRERNISGGSSSSLVSPLGGSSPGGDFTGTTAAFAAKLSANTGSDLILAAAARLTMAAGQPTFSRQTLLSEIQTASSYYKASYSKNFSNYLKRLTESDSLREVSTDTYSVSSAELQNLKAKLAS